MGTTKKSVKRRPSSAVKSHSKDRGKPKTSNSKRRSGPPIGPTITWSKVKCFALGLTVSHQWKYRKNGTTVTDWKAVLEVINDIYIQEFDDFKAIYPIGLTKAGKLRSEYSDRARGRHDKWRLKQDQCTTQEIFDMKRMSRIVFSTEKRLSQVPGSLVISPRPGAADWVWYEVQPPKSAAEKAAEDAARKNKRKHKRKVTEESGSEPEDKDEEEDEDSEEHKDPDEKADDDDNEEEEDSQQDPAGDANDEQDRSTKTDAVDEESSSGSDDLSDSEGDEGNIFTATPVNHTRPIIVIDDEDEDAERASDEEVSGNAIYGIITARKREGRVRPVPRQASPQRKKTRFNEVQTADEVDKQPESSRFFVDAFEDSAYGDVADNLPTFLFQQPSESLQTLGDLELLPKIKAREDGAVDIATIQAEGAAAIGTQDGLQITPARQTEFRRHSEQSDQQVIRYDDVMRFKGLAPPNYPPIQLLHDRRLNPARVDDSDGTTDSLSDYYALRRTLIATFQARRRIDFWAETQRTTTQRDVIDDIIKPMVMSTGMSPADVTNAVSIAADNKQEGSSIEFGQLLSMPTKIDQSKGEPNRTLEKIVQQINRQTKLQMMHTNDVDFSTQPPTYTIRKYTSGFGNEFRFVRSSNTLYSQMGEVRRVLLTDETTGQGKEVDVMLCDKPLCEECDPRDDMFERNFNYAEQRRQLPLVHHKDVLMLEDKNLYFAPIQQGPVLYGATVIKRDIHEVIFGHGFSKIIFCDKARCRACRGTNCVASLVYRDTR